MLNYQLQEKMIQSFQEFFISWKPFISFLNNFDKPYFYFFLVITVWFLTKQKTGYRLFFLMIFSTYINAILKAELQLPRPSDLAWVTVYGYGMPSGGAQSALVLALFGIKEGRNRFFTLFCVCYCLLVSFSRVLLGVHYITDVLGGWFIGGACYWMYSKFYLANEESFFPLKNYKVVFHNALFLLLPAFVFPYSSVLKLASISMGMLLGSFCFPLKNWDEKKPKEKITVVIPVLLLIGLSLVFYSKNIHQMNDWEIPKNLITGFGLFFFMNLFKKIQFLRK